MIPRTLGQHRRAATPLPLDARIRRWLLAALVFVLPLHTVFVDAWIAWKPFLILLIVLAGWDVVDGVRQRHWPWHGPASLAVAVFLGAMAVSWIGDAPSGRALRLWLALGVGALLLLVMERALRADGADRLVMRTIVYSGAALAVTAVALSLAVIGPASVVESIGDIPGVFRVAKSAYLADGFVALTNWHQDPGYAAAWMNLWAALVMVAWSRGWGFTRWWINALIVGGLGAGTFMTLSRTGWLGFVVALAAAAGFLMVKDRLSASNVLRFVAASAGIAILIVGILWVIDPPDQGADLDAAVSYRLTQGGSLGAPETGGAGIQDTRLVVWPRYIDAFEDDPALGIGLGTGWETMQEPHNLGLQLIGETGLIGLLGFVALAAVVFRYGSGTIGAVALTVVGASMITQTVLFEPTMWFAAALYLGRTGRSFDLSSISAEIPIP